MPSIRADTALAGIENGDAVIGRGVEAAIEVPAAAEVVLRSRADDRGLLLAVDRDHLVAFEESEPFAAPVLHKQSGSHEMALARGIEDRVVFAARGRVFPTPG